MQATHGAVPNGNVRGTKSQRARGRKTRGVSGDTHESTTRRQMATRRYQQKFTNQPGSNQLVAGNTNLRRYQQEENQQQVVRGKEKSHLKEGNIVHVTAPNHGVSGLLVELHGHRR